MPRYVEVSSVRSASGITGTDLISDSDFEEIVEYMEYEVERFLNTSFSPKITTDQLEGDNTNRIILKSNPVLKVLAVRIDDNDIDMDSVQVDKQSGVLSLKNDAQTIIFTQRSGERYLARVKYQYGQLDETEVQTNTDDAEEAGTSVVIGVADAEPFEIDDYVEISGMDGFKEMCRITDISTNDITVDRLVYDHEADSLLTKFMVPKIGERMMIVASALAGVARVVGSSYTDIVGYDIGDLHIQKGEPYTQWRETATQLRKEWAEIRQSLRVRPAIG